ncbi:hypothetical protein NM688_g2428 [Phlebia brevispora]|uniref:Uncharacterized protein n=1 Tax=Phlebia brevispora TaxID=194682 RepID=A0ACC1T8I0_9APHY|nr:hypothetical protein NM688_g2428 [Phlebia brevispora]
MPTYTFAVWAPDYTDPDALNRRLSVRPKHFENAKPLIDKGVMRLGGALLDPSSTEKKMIGSVVVYEAESLEACRKIVEEDIYYTAGVWDKEKLVILPWISAAPLPPMHLD